METGHIILTCTIVERTEIIVGFRVLSVIVDGSLQGEDRLKTVGEAVVAASLGTKVKAILLSSESYIVIGHGCCGTIVYGKLPDVYGRFVLSATPIVESELVVVVELSVHQVDEIIESLFVASEQIFLVAAAVIEEVDVLALPADV